MTTRALSGVARRHWTSDQKLRIVEDSLRVGSKVVDVAQRHGVAANLIYAWRRWARGHAAARASLDEARFVPITLAATICARSMSAEQANTNVTIEVVLRNGRSLRLPQAVAPSRVGALADALEGIVR